MNNKLSMKKMVTSAICLALCLVLPFLTGQIPQIGAMLSPMHIPVLLCGFLCGPLWGAVVGITAPLLRSVLFGMPRLFPTAIAMCFELCAYGFFAGFLYRRMPKKPWRVYAALICAMILGRLVWGAAQFVLLNASGSAMKAHDSILASDGTYTLTAGSDGLHAEDNDDDSVGSIVIEGGSFTIQAGDDSIHGTTNFTVNGGTLSITAAEGIEATQVILNDGSVSIKAQDDGINAGRKSSSLSVRIEINGGDITIVMGSGDTDGVDSNGDLVITGGTIDISGQSPFDYDGSCTYIGGTIIVNGVETNSVSNQMMGGGMKGGPDRSRW